MFLRQNQTHQSVSQINFECSGLTLIAGENGSGKTQLLHAIKNGFFLIDGSVDSTKAAYFNYSLSIGMGGTKEYSGYRNPTELAAGTLGDPHFQRLLGEARHVHLGKFRELFEESARHLLKNINSHDVILQVVEKSGAQIDEVRSAIASYNQALAPHLTVQHSRDGTAPFRHNQSRAAYCPYVDDVQLAEVVIGLSTEDFFSKNAHEVEIDVADTFMKYFYKTTLANEKTPSRYDRKNVPIILSKSDFEQRFGSPPWETFEQVLALCGLNYLELVKPSLHASYTPYFLRTPDNIRVPLDALSSGEKVMLGLALIAYQTPSYDRNELILLDEVDALLNPTLAEKYIAVLDIIKNNSGKSIIATTHSPTTVALWPEGTMYLMNRFEPRLQITDKMSILNYLSASLFHVVGQTLRLILVEDRDDAEFYSIVSEASASSGLIRRESVIWLSCRELQENRSGTVPSGGKQVVKGWLSSFGDAVGVGIVKALCDRDRDGSLIEGMHVLERYAIENYIYDPVYCLISFCLHESSSKEWPFGGAGLTLLDFSSRPPHDDVRKKLQDIVLAFADGLKDQLYPEAERSVSLDAEVDVPLRNGLTLRYPAWLLMANGHSLVNAYCSVVKGLSSRREKMLTTIKSFPDWMPVDITLSVDRVAS